MYQAIVKIHRLTNSFGEEFQSTYKPFLDTYNEYLAILRNLRAKDREQKRRVVWLRLCESAGEFHEALREKLISIRDS
jgi:hypothetical protein